MLNQPVIHLLSGGLDSTAMLYDLRAQGIPVHCLLFNYGQVNIQELDCARRHCQSTDTLFTVVELHRIRGLFARSALTDGKGSKIVPNRNAVFLHIAASIAAGQGVEQVTIGMNKDDQRDFPDCSPEFLAAINLSLFKARLDVLVFAPYMNMTKAEIVQNAREHGWPIGDTISCYQGYNCGRCDACKARKAALA